VACVDQRQTSGEFAWERLIKMHIFGKGGMQYRPTSIAHAKAEKELVEVYTTYQEEMRVVASLGACLAALGTPQPAIPVPHAGRPQSTAHRTPGKG
jgi:hypothetical protein